MLETIIGTITGPIGWALGAIVAVVGAWLVGKRKGTTGERERRAGQDAKDYRDERGKIDETDLGHGASDGERIARLHEVFERRKRERKD